MNDLAKTALRTSSHVNFSPVREAKRLEAQIAMTETAEHHAYSLRHDVYAAAGYIAPQPSGVLDDCYDRLPSSKTIVLYKNGKAAASARVCLLDDASSLDGASSVPACETFGPEIKSLLVKLNRDDRPARAVEITKMARHPNFMKDNDLVFAMFRMTGYLILHFDADVVLTLVRAGHIPFYKRLGFHTLADPRPYPNLKVSTGLMACFRDNYDDVQRTVPVLGRLSKDDEIMSNFLQGNLVPALPFNVPIEGPDLF